MAKKARKLLVQDVKVGDVILLDRPEAEIVKIERPEKVFTHAPKGKVFIIKDKKGSITQAFFLDEDKVDALPRKSLMEKFWLWVSNNYKKHQQKMASLDKKNFDLKDTPFGWPKA